jgi:signal transduction histidine kinase/ActR/RegA family two-component response regulator
VVPVNFSLLLGEVRRLGGEGAHTRRILGLSLVSFTLLLLTGVAAIYLAVRSAETEDAIVQGTEVRKTARSVLVEVLNSETGQRGYLLTGDDKYLKPYVNAQAALDSLLLKLREVASDDDNQQPRIGRLKALVESKKAELQRTVTLMRQGQRAEALAIVRSGDRKEVMDAIRAEIDGIIAEEQRRLALRQGHSSILRVSLIGLICFCLISAIALAVLTLRAVLHYLHRLDAEAKLRRETEEALRQSQKMEAVGQLTGGIAHDFNNMLAVITSGVNLALKRLSKGEAGAEALLSSASEAAYRAASLVKRLLAFARQQPLEPKPIDANKLLSGMSELISRSLGESIRVETILGGGLWLIHADPAELENSILNLCVNARDAMPEGGRLTVETANCQLDDSYARLHPGVPAGQYVMIAVTDTGTGMTAEVLAKAFDPFFTTKDTGKGTGLGLSQIFGFVKQSGGHVKIYSEPGEGTAVKVYLPRYYTKAKDQIFTGPPSIPVEVRGTEAILVVEDDANVLAMVTASLRELGYQVFEARHATEAVALLKDGQAFDLLLTDIVMPDINGRKLAEEAAALRPGLKILFMTGFTKNAIVHNGVLDPGVNFLAKPFTFDELSRKVREAMTTVVKP